MSRRSPIRSMTGYARVKQATPIGEATFSIKSVNHRGLDLQLSVPSLLDPFELDLRSAIKRYASRGHVELRISVERQAGLGVSVRRDLLDAYVSTFREISTEYGLAGSLDLNAALQIPGMIQENSSPDLSSYSQDELRAAFVGGVEACCATWNEFREREGRELAADMKARLNIIDVAGSVLGSHREAATAAVRKRLEERVAELALKLEPARLAQEAALIVERSDISEEIARLTIHARQLGELLDGGGEIGKKLDFLLQETNREANTILSKSANAGEAGIALGDAALTIKSEIEKIREQSLNVE